MIKEIDIGKFIPDINLTDLFSMDVSMDGAKIAWAYEQSLYIYDINDDIIYKIFENSNNEAINFLKIKFTALADNIVYYGNTSINDAKSTNYGIVNINSKDIKNFIFNTKTRARDIGITKNYAYIIDEEDEKSLSTSGIVAVIDLKNNETFDIKVDTFESSMSAISYNEKYLISAIKYNDDYIRIRQYSFESEKIKELKYKIDDNSFYPNSIITLENGKAYILLCNNNAYRYIEFICKEY